MSSKLRDLIRLVRACKTAQDERAVISKECAMIRTAFKENNVAYRHRNVAKLLFIHMLGYPSHFGQMECLKLIASPNFPEKRIGYLALMLLLDTKSEVLTLVTNSIKNDLAHPNQFVVGLALASVGNLATGDMGRILISDADRVMRASNPYLKKKAALVMIRIFKRVPEMIEEFADKVVVLLKERTHGALIAGVQLMVTILELEPTQAQSFGRLVPSLVRLLRNLLSMGYSPEHDVAGITDPFLQVKLLRLLQLLGRGNEEASDAMNDILAQVATNTETAKNAGNAILYEAVKAIMTIEAEAGLRVLAVNILGRFLLNRDNNIRYVALNTLSKVVVNDMDTVQRHRQTIVDCLKDPDVSIRQRALELIYQLTNSKNVTELMREMLNYLVVASAEQKAPLCSRIMATVDKYSPSTRWRIDTLITMLSIAGNSCDDSISANTIMYVTVAEELQAYTVHKLFSLLSEDLAQLQLVHVGVWCIGEYGNLLLAPCPPAPDDQDSPGFPARSGPEVCALLDKVKKNHTSTKATKSLVLTTFAKLSQRVRGSADAAVVSAKVLDHLAQYKESLDMELQQRSVEFATLLVGEEWASLRPTALERMPPMDEEKLKAKRARESADGNGDEFALGNGDAAKDAQGGAAMPGLSGELAAPSLSTPVAAQGGGDLLDLDDIFGGGMAGLGAPAAASSSPAMDIMGMGAPSTGGGAVPGGGDLLADIFAVPASAPPSAGMMPGLDSAMMMPAMTAPAPIGTGMPDQFLSPAILAPSSQLNPSITAFEKNGLSVAMELVKSDPADPAVCDVTCTFNNSASADMTSFVFQAAVPKYLELKMRPPSGSVVPSGSTGLVTQVLSVKNTQLNLKTLMFRMKISYSLNGQQVSEQSQVSAFPMGY